MRWGFGLTSVQTRRDVCPHGGERLAGDDPFPNGGLDGYLEELPGDDLVWSAYRTLSKVHCSV